MLNSFRTLFFLVDYPVKSRIILSVLGAFVVSLLELTGVLATYPLLLLASGQGLDNPLIQVLINLTGLQERQQLISLVACLVVAAFVLKGLVTIAFRWWQAGFMVKVERSARVKLLSLYLDSPYQVHRQRDLSTLHTNLATAIPQSFGQAFFGSLSLLTNLLTVTFIFVIVFWVSPLAALVALLLFAGTGYLVPALLKRRLVAISHQYTESDYINWYSSMPALTAFREMRLFGVAKYFTDEYDRGVSIRAKGQREQTILTELPRYIIEIVFVLGLALLATFLFSTQDQAQALATMGVFSVAAVRLIPAINAAMASMNVIRAGSAGMTLINREIESLRQLSFYSDLPSGGKSPQGDIVIDRVTYAYQADQEPVLKQMSLTIPEKSTVAFVGPSGSGKSTLVDLILGLLEPDQGQILCGGSPLKEDLKAWQRAAGVVPQQVYVLPGSLAHNVAFGLPEEQIDRDQVLRALEAAELGDLLASLPQGLDQELGQDGARLSGGQRQRLGIARALYRKPSLLVLDEATSALDNKTEHKITQTIEQLKGDMTIIMVAHRLSTIKGADLIFYLADGRLKAQGSFEELVASEPDFRELVELGKLA